jgi:Uma2 family endonuclease
MNAPTPQPRTPHAALIRSDDYEKMVRAGALDRLGRVELRDGTICDMNPQHSEHGYIKSDLAFELRGALRRIGSVLRVGTEITLRADEFNSPAPDISVCDTFPPGPIPVDAVRLLIEVADTTLADDLGVKRVLYARVGIPEYWVVDVRARTIHLHAEPAGESYLRVVSVRFGEPLAALTIPGLNVDTSVLG